MLRHLFVATVLLAAPVAAQVCHPVPDNVTNSGSCNVFPFGSTSSLNRNQKYQHVVFAQDLGRPACPSLNGTATQIQLSPKHNTNTFAIEVPAQKTPLSVLGFELLTGTGTAAPVTIQTRLHLATGAVPVFTPARTGTMRIEKNVGWYRTLFTSPITIAPGNKFFISHAPNTSMYYSHNGTGASSGAKATYYWHSPTSRTWRGPIRTYSYRYRVICAGSCLNNNEAATTIANNLPQPNIFAQEVPATSVPRTVTGFDFLCRATATTTMTIQLYGQGTGGAPGSVLRTGTMRVGTRVGWYQGTLSSPVVIPANTKFFITWVPHTNFRIPLLGTFGDPSVYYWRTPTSTTWNRVAGRYWAWKVRCAGAGRISCLSYAPCRTGNAHFDRILVRMGYLNNFTGKLTNNFANNITGAVTVLSLSDYDWPVVGNQWNPIGLQRPFLYDPLKGPMVIEITVWGANTTTGGFRSGPRERLHARGWTTAPPATGNIFTSAALKVQPCYDTGCANNYGVGCRGSNSRIPTHRASAAPRINRAFRIFGTNALPNARYFWVVGLNRMVNPYLLPGGFPCKAYPSLDAINIFVMNNTGSHSITVAPPSSTFGATVYSQVFPFDSRANAFGTSASNYLRLHIGL